MRSDLGDLVYATGANQATPPDGVVIGPGKRLYQVSVFQAATALDGAVVIIGDGPRIFVPPGVAYTIGGNDTPDYWRGPIQVFVQGNTPETQPTTWVVIYGTPQDDQYPLENCDR